MKEKRHIYTPVFVSVIIILIILMKLVDSTFLNRENEYVAVILLECVIFALPGIIFTRLTHTPEEKSIKMAPFKANAIIICLLGALILVTGSILYGFIVSKYDTESALSFSLYDVFTAKYTDSVGGVLYLITAYAIIPAFFEEFTFRGIVCSKYEVISPIYAVIMSSLMFAFIHLDELMFPFYVFAGLLLAVSLYVTGSVFATIAVHFIYNLVFIFSSVYISSIFAAGKEVFLFICGVVFFSSLAFFCAECRKVYSVRSQTEPLQSDDDKEKINVLEIILSPTAIVCYLIYFTAVIIF